MTYILIGKKCISPMQPIKINIVQNKGSISMTTVQYETTCNQIPFKYTHTHKLTIGLDQIVNLNKIFL